MNTNNIWRWNNLSGNPRRNHGNLTMGVLIVILALAAISFAVFDIETVEGNQVAVMETWGAGVKPNIYGPRVYFLFPGEKLYPYDMSQQVFVMNNKPHASDPGNGRAMDAYTVQSSEGQDMTFSVSLTWMLNPTNIVEYHKRIKMNPEEKLIRPLMMRIIKDTATPFKAFDAYAGEGLVRLQSQVQSNLWANQDIKEFITVINFVIEENKLDPKYTEEIKGKQIATQKVLRAAEEQKAAQAEAEVVKAKAQADANKQTVEAERDATVAVTKAKADNEKRILEAEAQKQTYMLESEGKLAQAKAEAEGILVKGEAEAKAKRANLEAYQVQGTDAYVKVEIAKAASESFKGIQGYLPSDMTVNVLSENFMKSIQSFMTAGGTPTPTVAAPVK